jgi:hypothetical protein
MNETKSHGVTLGSKSACKTHTSCSLRKAKQAGETVPVSNRASTIDISPATSTFLTDMCLPPPPVWISLSLSMDLQPFGPWSLFQFLNLYTVGRTHWTVDQPVARPLPAHRTTETHNKRTQTPMPRVGFEPTIPVLELPKTVHAIDRAATVIGVSGATRLNYTFQNSPQNYNQISKGNSHENNYTNKEECHQRSASRGNCHIERSRS